MLLVHANDQTLKGIWAAKKNVLKVNSVLPPLNLVIEKTPYELTRGRITCRQKQSRYIDRTGALGFQGVFLSSGTVASFTY